MLLELLLRLLVWRPGISSVVIAMSSLDRESDVRYRGEGERRRKSGGSGNDVPSKASSFPVQQLVLPISAFAQRIDRHSRQLGVYRILA
jgi:hypothetical protein